MLQDQNSKTKTEIKTDTGLRPGLVIRPRSQTATLARSNDSVSGKKLTPTVNEIKSTNPCSIYTKLFDSNNIECADDEVSKYVDNILQKS